MSARRVGLAIAVLGIVVVTFDAAAHGGRGVDRRRGVDRKGYDAAFAAWRNCFAERDDVPEFPSMPEEDDFSPRPFVRRTGAGFLVDSYSGGMGVEAVFDALTIDFRPDGCRALWLRQASYDGAMATRTRIGWVNRSRPVDSDVRTLVAEPGREADPAHAFPRVWLTHRCPGGPDSELEWTRAIEGPIAPAQPWHLGTPRRAPATFWSIAALDTIGSRAHWRPSDDDHYLPPGRGPEIAGIVVPSIGQPARTFSAAGVEIFEAEIPGRNGGRAIALRDRTSNRHRWVVVTRGCVQGTTVQWMGAVGSRIIGVTRSVHGHYVNGTAILIVDVPSGTAWAVRLPEAIREAARDGVRIGASLLRSKVTLRTGKTTSALDLGPMLATIPSSK